MLEKGNISKYTEPEYLSKVCKNAYNTDKDKYSGIVNTNNSIYPTSSSHNLTHKMYNTESIISNSVARQYEDSWDSTPGIFRQGIKYPTYLGIFGRSNTLNSSILANEVSLLYGNKKANCYAFPSIGIGYRVLLDYLVPALHNKIIVDKELSDNKKDEIYVVSKHRNFSLYYIDTTNINHIIDKIASVKPDIFIMNSVSLINKRGYSLSSLVTAIKKECPECIIVIDNTNATVFNYNPFLDGADIVIDNMGDLCTKFPEIDLTVVLTNDELLVHDLLIKKEDAFNCQYALSTALVRKAKIEESCIKIKSICDSENIKLYYLGSGDKLILKLKNNQDCAEFCRNLKLIKPCSKLAINSSTAYVCNINTEEEEYHPLEYRKKIPKVIDTGYVVVISIGLEDTVDLINDILQSINKLWNQKN